MTVAMWFRNDLRINDNPALHAACSSQMPVIGIYLFTPDQLRAHGVGQIKQRFIIDSLISLGKALAGIGIPLLVVPCKFYSDSTKKLAALCKQHQVSHLYHNEEYELNEQRRDTLAFSLLGKAGIPVHRYQDQVVLAPGAVMTQQGSAFRVYTPFKRCWMKLAQQESISPLPAPRKQKPVAVESTPVTAIDKLVQPHPASALWKAGSREAASRMLQFREEKISRYQDQRDFPAIDATSQLSPYLAVGAISQRSCLYAALEANRFEWDSGNKGIQTWINELIWREFYKHLVFNFPEICKGRAFQPVTNGITWDRCEDRLQLWQQGQTGFPLVDAAMRQLNTLGWMHNRLRMVTAMFLTKHLFIDWHLGESWFMQQLVDADFAANNGGWQWSASTGADAAPYFRVFNPTRQSERFDPDGAFIRKWVPELASLSARSIHDPNPLERQQCQYPLPMVDHRTAVNRVKSEFKALKDMEHP